jgi:hypothetical protein
MTPDLLRRMGAALYGERWQLELAEALGVSDRSMRYWVAGSPIPQGIWAKLGVLLERAKLN